MITPHRATLNRNKMEPGGIEPPYRNSQHNASTRVSIDLISVATAANGSIRENPAAASSRPRTLRLRLGTSPMIIGRPSIGRQRATMTA